MRGHVQRHGSGHRGIIYLGRGADGRKRYRYLPTVPTEEQAQVMVADTIGELYRGTYIEPTKTTFGQLLDRWLQHKSRSGRKPGTIRWYRSIIEEHLKPLDLENYYDAALAAGQKAKSWGKQAGEGLSESSVAGHHRLIHAALARALAWRLIAANPADLVEPPQPAEGQKRALTVAQATKLLAAAAEKARQPELYVLAVTTAMREGELLGLRWQDVEPPLVHVRQALKRAGRNPEFGPVKSKAGERTVCLLPQALDALDRVKVRQQAERVLAGTAYEDHDLVFALPNGHPHNLVQREFKQLLAIAGLPRTTRFHDLRHTAATALKTAGVDDLAISHILGHSDLAVTRRYTAVMTEVLQQAAEKLAAILFPEGENPEKPRTS